MRVTQVPLGWAAMTVASLCLASLSLLDGHLRPSTHRAVASLDERTSTAVRAPSPERSTNRPGSPTEHRQSLAHHLHGSAHGAVPGDGGSSGGTRASAVPTSVASTTTTTAVVAPIAAVATAAPTWTGYLVAPDAASATYTLTADAPNGLRVASTGSAAIEVTSTCSDSSVVVAGGAGVTTGPLTSGCALTLTSTSTSPVPYVVTGMGS